jgi:hypothetical protein
MVKRSLSDPRSLVGASLDEIRALKPEGWLMRPLPPGRSGFQMLSPSKMPGARGRVSVRPGGCGFRTFGARPAPWLFVLNSAAEQSLLAEILENWARAVGDGPATHLADISLLAGAARRLAQDRLIQAYLDPLEGDELVPLGDDQVLSTLADAQNWWRDEDDPDTPAATSLIALDITKAGEEALAAS